MAIGKYSAVACVVVVVVGVDVCVVVVVGRMLDSYVILTLQRLRKA